MNAPTLFDPGTPDPGNDAAPSGNGAGANGPNTPPDLTRLPLSPPAPHNAPAGTSSIAARRIAGHTPKLRARVLAYIVGRGADGATDDEGEAALGIKPQTYTPRRGELVALGLVVDSTRRRKTGSGRPAAVWIAATFATAGPVASGDARGPEGGKP